MGVNMSIPAAYDECLSQTEQLEWLYKNKENLLTAGANIKITRSGDTVVISAEGEGFSPTVNVEVIPGGHRVTITDGEGPHVFDVMDGQDGKDGTDGTDGTSVTFATASITGGTRVTLTDGDHSSSFDVMNGADGEDITITDVTVISSGTQVTFSDDTVIVIPNGLTGPKGIPGVNGRNVFIKYADAQPTQDSDMKDIPSAFMGVYSGTATTAPTTYTDYLWYQIKGDKGDTGNTGAAGQDGVSPTLSAEPISGGHRVTMTDAQGTTTFDVMDGENAAAATVTVGSTTTGEPGTNASVTNSGTSSAAVLDFVIPRGNAGPAGSNGANVFVKYAANQPTQDSDMKDTIDEWIGIHAGTETTAPTTYTSYQWFKIKGYDGISPTVTVTQLVNGYHVEIVSAGGTETFDLYNGADGADGADGQGVPTGGTAGQILAKVDGTNYNTEWIDPPSGGGGGLVECRIADSGRSPTYVGSFYNNSTQLTPNTSSYSPNFMGHYIKRREIVRGTQQDITAGFELKVEGTYVSITLSQATSLQYNLYIDIKANTNMLVANPDPSGSVLDFDSVTPIYTENGICLIEIDGVEHETTYSAFKKTGSGVADTIRINVHNPVPNTNITSLVIQF